MCSYKYYFDFINFINIVNLQKMIFIIVLLTFLLSISQNKLLYLNQINLHGSRYPINDLYDGNQSNQGELTSIGQRQSYLLGSYLKHDYIDEMQFIPAKADPVKIEFLSSSYDRDVESALAFINGLFPLQTGWTIPSTVPADKLSPPYTSFKRQRIVSEINSEFALNEGMQLLPIYTIDDLVQNCSKFGVLMTNRLKQVNQTLLQFQKEQSLLISKMVVVFNLSALQATVAVMSSLYDTLWSDLNVGRQIPKQVDSIDLKQLKYINNYYQTLVYDGSFGQLLSTSLLSLCLSKMDQVINRDSNAKLWTFQFVRETPFIPILTTLNLTSHECIYQRWKNQTMTTLSCMEPTQFASSLIFELYEDDTFEHYVKVKLNGEYAYLCEKKSQQCEYQEFKRRVKAKFVDWKKICVTG